MANAQKDDNSNNELGEYRQYIQSSIIDNVISCLLAPKKFDELGNATTELKTSSTNFILTIREYYSLTPYMSSEFLRSGKLKQSIGKLLDSFIIKMTEKGFDNHTVILKLTEYAEMTGKKSISELRKQTNNDLKILKSIHIKNEPLNGKGIYFEGKICNCSDKIENGKMKFKFDENLFKVLSNKNVSFFRYLPIEVLQISEKATNAYLLYKRVLANCWSNAGSLRENIIKIKTLYNYCSTLPRYEKVDGITQRYKEPLKRDFNKIQAFTCRELYSTNYDNASFEEWLDMDLHIEWKQELKGIQELREAREKHKKKQEQAKEKALVKSELNKLKKVAGGKS